MSSDYQKLLRQVSELRRAMANMFQVGTVHEVKGTKLRMVVGKDDKGKDVLSPWLNTANHRGGATEQRFYKKGQTLGMFCPGGDMAQGMISPYAPNKKFKTPEQADGSGQDEESYQLADYRAKQTKDGNDQWLQPDSGDGGPDGTEDGGGGEAADYAPDFKGVGQKKPKKGHVGGAKATMKQRMNKDGGITNRVGTDARMHVHKDGVKMRTKKDWIVVSEKSKKIFISQPPIIGRDPIKNDDA